MQCESDLHACAALLLQPDGCRDPYPLYRELRLADGPLWVPGAVAKGHWLLTRYADVVSCLKQSRASTNPVHTGALGERPPIDGSMLLQDAPNHTRLRGLVGQAFTAGRVARLEARMEVISRELIDRIPSGEEFDFMASFAEPFPVIVIAELLGVPADDRQMFCTWSGRLIAGTGMAASHLELQQLREASANLTQYLTAQLQERRRHPGDDLMSSLIAARDRDGKLTEAELLGTCVLLLMAGNETTINLLGNGMLTLLQHPDQMAVLRDNPAQLPAAIEELLRFESPVQRALLRVVTETIVIGTTQIEAGQHVSALLGAANRDPAQFPDPDQFDPRRSPNRHVAFGAGMHFCLGAVLARAEARIGFGQLLSLRPALRLAEHAGDWRLHPMFRGLRQLRLAS